MTQRSIGTSILLSIVTCSVYLWYWLYKMTEEITAYNGEDANPTTELLLSMFTCGIYYLYWNYKMGKRIAQAQSSSSDDSVLYVLLSAFGLGIVSLAIMQNNMNSITNA